MESGSRVGDWIVDWPLGSGGSGVVYRCHRSETPSVARALKLLLGRPTGEAKRRFEREIAILRTLDHPSLVKLVDSGEVAQRPYLVSELARGRSLASLINQPPIEPALACHIVGQLADALAYAHGQGIAHRDLKPSNVLVEADGTATLIDFGIASVEEASRITRASAQSPATPPYAPPEWWVGTVADAQAADVYALGLVLFELLAGERVFVHRLPEDVAERKRSGPLTPDRGPSEIRALVARCTALEPGDRPSATEVAAALPRLAPEALPVASERTLPVTQAPEALLTEPIAGHRVVEVLGEGGMGVVYRAEDPSGDPVALKWLRFPVPVASEQEKRFQREFAVLSRLDHPGVVRVFESGRHEGRLFYTMEWVEGPDLATWLRERGPMEPDRALALGIEAARALAHVHAAGLVHRDIKPGNLLLEEGVRPRIADFGLAQDAAGTAPLTRDGAVLGTPAYMAPEQARGEAVGPSVDVYALGAVLYELICGERAIEGRSPIQVLHHLENNEVVPLDRRIAGVPVELARVVHKAMAREIADRYPTMEAFLEDLERLRSGRAPLARAPSPGRRLARTLKRRRVAVVAAAASLLAGVALVGGLQWARSFREQAAETERFARAEARLQTLRPTLTGLDPEAGRAAVEAFVQRPEHRASPAQSRAWLAWAQVADDPESRLEASARAWGAVVAPEEERASLGSLATALGETERWDGLGNVLAALEGFHGGAPDALKRRWSYGRRDFTLGRKADARPGVEPLLDVLSHARQLRAVVDVVGEVDTDADGERELLLLEGEALVVAERGAPEDRRPLGIEGISEIGEVSVHEVSGYALLRVRRDGRVVVYELGSGAPVEVHQWEDASMKAFAVGDLDGNGVDELLLGNGAYSRRLVALEPRPDGTWRFFEPHPDSNTQNSGFQMLGFDDLDGDGTQEFVQVRGAFGAYDVRVLRPGEGGGLVARRKLGDTQHGALIRGPGDAKRIVAVRLDRWANRYVLPPDAPFGEQPQGVWVLDWDGTALQTGWTRGTTRPCDYVQHGDLDGDGLDDLAVTCQTDTLLARQRADGSFVDVVLRDVVVRGFVDLDVDGDDEVLVEDWRTRRMWVLGSGDDVLPVLPFEGAPVPTGVSAAERAASLVELGLPGAGARAWEDLAVQAPDPDEAARAYLAAGLAWEAAGEPQRAVDALTSASESEAVRVDALDAAARILLATQRLSEARDSLERLGDDERLEPLVRHLDAPRVVLDFGDGLPSAVDVTDPVQAWHDPAAGVLRIQQVDDAVVARVPLELTGDGLSLEVELATNRLEWGSGLSISVAPVGDHASTGLGGLVHGMGGGGNHFTQVKCTDGASTRRAPQWPFPRETPDDPVVLTLRAGILPGLSSPSCAWDGLPRPATKALEPVVEPTGPHELRIRALDRWGNGLVDVSISKITVRGAQLASEDLDSLAEARRALVTQQPDRALQLLERESVESRLLEVLARLDLGQDRAVREGLRDLADDGTLDERGAALLRTRGDRLAPGIAAAVGDDWPDLLWDAWQGAVTNHRDDPHWRERLARDLGPAEDLPSSSALVQLLIARSRASQDLGRLGAAQTDASLALRMAEEVGAEEVPALLRLAEIRTARGEQDAALELVHRALERSPSSEILADALVLDPALAPLRSLSGWSVVSEARAVPSSQGG